MFVLIGTVLFQIFINWRFGPLLRYLPTGLGNHNAEVRDQAEAMEEDTFSMSHNAHETYNINDSTYGHSSAQGERPITEDAELPTTLLEVTASQKEKLIAAAFDHIVLSHRQLRVWIPQDKLNISVDEVRQTKQFGDEISISSEGASLDDQDRVVYKRYPPDFFYLARVKL
ncbi:uncharacterized protein FIESC28_00661 [Fusarium coffeatum]|uniref:10TM putative phosphate transporter extracellular tail domain-containing protein n=1 Tax=Fusarium coffeatum TaxID=231269 RepID=A0A366SB39_9HYPO|nr:uncharacterized protein FIESC28_00661 [Fusarium coffeatum]RBR26544.1 hypothetical protein FIESC28_00661 [Fusarium coffeatum]